MEHIKQPLLFVLQRLPCPPTRGEHSGFLVFEQTCSGAAAQRGQVVTSARLPLICSPFISQGVMGTAATFVAPTTLQRNELPMHGSRASPMKMAMRGKRTTNTDLLPNLNSAYFSSAFLPSLLVLRCFCQLSWTALRVVLPFARYDSSPKTGFPR